MINILILFLRIINFFYIVYENDFKEEEFSISEEDSKKIKNLFDELCEKNVSKDSDLKEDDVLDQALSKFHKKECSSIVIKYVDPDSREEVASISVERPVDE